jgi:hypothetical protein
VRHGDLWLATTAKRVLLAPWVAVTPTTDRTTALSGEAAARRAAARATAFAAGAVAAGLGLGVLTAVVLLLWIASPFPDSGLGGALHTGAGLWLLAQGADLVRTGTLSGTAAPIGVTPLLLTALPGWLLHRAAASAVRTDDGEPPDAPGVRTVAATAGWLLAGYLAVASGAVAYAATGPLPVDLPTALLYVPLFGAAVTAAGVWAGCGRPSLARSVPYGADVAVALRAAGMAVGVVLGGGALLGAASLTWHAGTVGRTFAQLSGPMAGRVAVLLLALALVPNLAVWGAAYALGPGFTVGAGSTVWPAGASGYPPLPGFPLLAALPGEGSGGLPGRFALGLPLAAGALVAWYVGRRTASDAGLRRTALVASGAAFACGLAFAGLAAASGGPLGTAALAEFGPAWWRTGGAALGWTLLLGAPGAMALRWARTRPPAPPAPPAVARLAVAVPPAPSVPASPEVPPLPVAVAPVLSVPASPEVPPLPAGVPQVPSVPAEVPPSRATVPPMPSVPPAMPAVPRGAPFLSPPDPDPGPN